MKRRCQIPGNESVPAVVLNAKRRQPAINPLNREKVDKGRQVGLERKAPPHAKHEVIPERNATTDATI